MLRAGAVFLYSECKDLYLTELAEEIISSAFLVQPTWLQFHPLGAMKEAPQGLNSQVSELFYTTKAPR